MKVFHLDIITRVRSLLDKVPTNLVGSLYFFLHSKCQNVILREKNSSILGKSFQHGADVKGEMKQFYNQRWFIDQDYIPDVALDLAEFRQQFCASVRRHLLAEVPFGLLLSGGLDSSLVASIAFREYKKLGNNDVLKSFCIGKCLLYRVTI